MPPAMGKLQFRQIGPLLIYSLEKDTRIKPGLVLDLQLSSGVIELYRAAFSTEHRFGYIISRQLRGKKRRQHVLLDRFMLIIRIKFRILLMQAPDNSLQA